MRTYKILHIIGGGEIGGAEQHVLTLLNGLNKTRFEPYLACLTHGPFAELAISNGIPTQTFLMRHPLDLTLLPTLIRWAKKNSITLIHTHGSRANLLGRIAAKWLNISCVSTVHSSLSHDYLSRWSARIAIGLDRLTLPLTAGIITVSEHLAEEVAKRGGKNIVTIYNGQTPLLFDNLTSYRENFRERWRIPSDAIVIGTIGRLHPTKGQQYLIKAVHQLRTLFPNVHLLLIGEGPIRQTLETEFECDPFPHTMTGYLPNAYEALPAMDLFVLPSVSEGMGLVLLEAMQAGLPIVASNVGGIPEVVRSGMDGILVPPCNADLLAEACAKILENYDLAQSLILSGRGRWPMFSVDAMVRSTETFYNQIVDHSANLRS